jgi:hypothetical protein
MANLETRVSAKLIGGKSPAKVRKELISEGVPRHEIERALDENAEVVAASQARRTKHRVNRMLGGAIFLAATSWNIYYLLYWPSGRLVFGLMWMIAMYGLMVMLLGDWMWRRLLDQVFGQ